MKRTTMGVRLDPRIRARLERLAAERGQVVSEVARAILAEGLRREEARGERADEDDQRAAS